ncbi:MAG: 3'-5' exonuclease [Betaproteobacteria bacterium]|nr:3'-5' exonuclease [Betaproteobacteria bacterium]NBT74591.1 3'-5' exonuclease [Betaproteobacteria bacterium]NBY13942.1 3'-5' exonuclease [Betaproteobacteria bacterium]NCA16387.1 3'-5' exonuclease [Betaproteobacteria bacterium]
MTPVLVFDLETVPDVAGMRKLGLFPEGLSDADGVIHVQAERHQAGQSTFFPHYLQRVWMIGCAYRDEEGFRVRCLGEGYGVSDEDEAHRIKQFFGTIDRYTPQLVSWNGSGFDAPVLHHRALIHGVSAPQYWDQGEHNRDFKYNNYLSRYHSRHLDLMDVLSGYSGRAGAPLDGLSQVCGLPGKLGEDGAQVWQACLEGRAEQVAAYCETDVVNTYLLYQRFRLMRADITRMAFDAECAMVRKSLESKIGQAGSPLQGEHWKKFLAAWEPGR